MFGNAMLHKRWLGIDGAALKKAEQKYQRWGVYSLLMAWLPVVGDPLCLLGGLMKVNFLVFLLLVAAGKVSRYAVLVYLAT